MPDLHLLKQIRFSRKNKKIKKNSLQIVKVGRRGRRFKSCRIDSLAGAPEMLIFSISGSFLCYTFLQSPYCSDSQSAGAHMSSYAHGKREIDQFHIRKLGLQRGFEMFQFIRIHQGVCQPDL